ncbi:polyisoprenoid-binding protein YceI [Catalinimonas alkaloidigena]|uniref:YceI family protein n=1 Tax=Catalinimonas alkaloidigena TaxID=1075417 RepID=UPI0024050461|nr:YceI family protein [Catalinimonas alkaloidigena]MDF9794835.1 polyisoprenoid-binding protein YceI [Catalinimonas alkaloidigena]
MKTLKYFSLAIFASFVMVSCAQKPQSDNAEVSEAQEVEEVSASAGTYGLDLSQSELMWNGFKPTGQHYGTIAIEDGAIAVENDEVVGGSFTVNLNEIDVQDLEGEDRDKLTGHLKSKDFFHVEQYPTAKFVITDVNSYSGTTASTEENDNMAVKVNDEEVSEYKLENPTHMVTGNLSMRDTTLSITFPAQINITNDQVTAEAKFNIDRTKWNVSYNDEGDPVRVAKDKFIYNTVNIGFDITANKGNQPQAPASEKTDG